MQNGDDVFDNYTLIKIHTWSLIQVNSKCKWRGIGQRIITRIQIIVPHKKSLVDWKVAMPAIESLSTASDVPLIS